MFVLFQRGTSFPSAVLSPGSGFCVGSAILVVDPAHTILALCVKNAEVSSQILRT